MLGTTLRLTTSNYPATSGLGVQVLSLVQHNPGLDMAAYGMPGCRQFVDGDVSVVLLPAGGQSVYTQIIPNNPALAGLPLAAQTFAFAPGANPLGVIAANGVAMVVGS